MLKCCICCVIEQYSLWLQILIFSFNVCTSFLATARLFRSLTKSTEPNLYYRILAVNFTNALEMCFVKITGTTTNGPVA